MLELLLPTAADDRAGAAGGDSTADATRPALWAYTFEKPPGDATLLLSIHHDEDAEVYVNGALAAELRGYTTDYRHVPIGPEARARIVPGRNLIAVHCRQTAGGQYVDVGLAAIRLPSTGGAPAPELPGAGP